MDETLDSMEVMKHLPEESAERYVAFEELFNTTGWTLASEWARVKALDAFSRSANAQSWDDSLVARGERQAYEDVSRWAESFMAEFRTLAEENKAEQELAVGDGFNE